ncbi:MAG: hypothetical protein R2771_05440 [Saprospiraceae bacterium]
MKKNTLLFIIITIAFMACLNPNSNKNKSNNIKNKSFYIDQNDLSGLIDTMINQIEVLEYIDTFLLIQPVWL